MSRIDQHLPLVAAPGRVGLLQLSQRDSQ